MMESLMDNRLTQRIAAIIEGGDRSLLGSRTTMRLGKSFNRLKNRRFHRFRQRLYEEELEQLLRENGEVKQPAPRMKDGWALDTSHSLPHLDQLIEDAQKIIAEEAGVKRKSGYRSFFVQIANDEHIVRYPSILDFATSSEILETVIDYCGFIPALSVATPPGVRLNESNHELGDAPLGQYQDSQLFHRDYHNSPMVYVIVTLRDVTHKSGPFSLLPASVSDKATKALRYGTRGRSYRITDEEMYKVVDRKHLFEMACPAGTVLFVDSSRCFHYGSRDAVVPRFMMMYAYVPVCRSDFGDLLRKKEKCPIPGSTNGKMTRYPMREDDSRLRRMLLDWRYME